MDHRLAEEVAKGSGNRRNGSGPKTLPTATGKRPIAVPRDRLSSFDPQLIAQYRRRLPGFDDKIVSIYARGLSVREIPCQLRCHPVVGSGRKRMATWPSSTASRSRPSR